MTNAILVAVGVIFFLSPARIADWPHGSFVTLLDIILVATGIYGFVVTRKVVSWRPLILVVGSSLMVTVAAMFKYPDVGRNLMGWIDFVYPMVIGSLLAALISERVASHRFLWGLVVGGVVLAIQAMALSVIPVEMLRRVGLQVFWASGASRGFSTLGGPNITAAIIAIALPVALYLGSNVGTGMKYAWVAFAVLNGGLLSTLTRGAWIAALAGVCALIWEFRQRRSLKRILLVFALGILPGIALMSSSVTIQDRTAAARAAEALRPSAQGIPAKEGPAIGSSIVTRVLNTNFNDFSVSDRWGSASAAVRLIADSPLLGHGTNSIMTTSYHYLLGGTAKLVHVHNTYLQLGLMFGVPIALLLLAIVGWPVFQVLRPRSKHSDEMKILGIVLLVTAVNGLTDYMLWYPRYSVVFWLLVMSLYQGLRREQMEPQGAEN